MLDVPSLIFQNFFWKMFSSPKPERKKVKNTNDTSLIFDITHEEIKNKKQVDDISLNGAKLIREQLKISENSKYHDLAL